MKKLIILLALIAVLLGGIIFWWSNGIRPVDASSKATQSFVITKGTSVRQIGNELRTDGLIRDPIIFFIYVKRAGLEKNLQAGTYHLSPAQSTPEIAQTLTVGRSDINVKFIEGIRAEEMAEILQKTFPQYTDVWLTTLQHNEGYLFPDTYSFAKDVTIDEVISTLRETFTQRFAQVKNNTTYTSDQIVIIASLIQREGRDKEDLPLISSVIQNRLKQGMPLQIDATVQYALGYDPYEKTWWKKDLSYDDLKIESPYNTYINTGLPPTPICNPGIDALEAAANPANTDYLYYITDKNGTNHYARTSAEHTANIKKYGL